MKPAISVVIPCRNERETLDHCLAALDAQRFPRERFEVIVVDGGSTDGSREVALARGVRLLDDGANGPSGARNIGIRAARADIIAFTDADCVPQDDWLTRIAEVFAEDATLAGVAGALRMPRSTLVGRLEDMDAVVHYRGFITSNVAYKRDVLLSIGGFDESLCCAEDYDLAWRAMDAGHRILHDRRPVVLHEPPEVTGPLATFLRKQFWYARNDVPTHLRALRRARATSSPGMAGSAEAARGMLHALRDAGSAAAVGSLFFVPELAALGAVALALQSGRSVRRTALQAGESNKRDIAAMALIDAGKRLARGAGTLVGYAELALPKKRALLTSPSTRSWGVAPSLAPRPRAARGASPWH